MFAFTRGAQAQQRASRLPRIGLVFTHAGLDDMAGNEPADLYARALFRGLRDLGFVEGKNILVERRSAFQQPERQLALMQELVALPVDMIVTPPPALDAALRATTRIPIVTVCNDPVLEGYSTNLARPSRNVTGMTLDAAARLMYGKRLQLLHEAAPAAKRIGVLGSSAVPGTPIFSAETEAAARALGLSLVLVAVDAPADIEPAFASVRSAALQALVVEMSEVNHAHMRRIAELAARLGLPTMYDYREPVAAGGLMSYGADVEAVYRELARFVGKLIKGAKPVDLPFQQPTQFEFVINLETAKSIGLALPRSLLLRADQRIG